MEARLIGSIVPGAYFGANALAGNDAQAGGLLP